MQQPGSHRRFRSESMEPGGRNGPSVEDILPLKKPALSPAAPDSGGQVAGGVSEPVGAGLSNETAAMILHKGLQAEFPIGHKESLPLAGPNAARLGADLIHDTMDALPAKPTQIVQVSQPEISCSLLGRTESGQTTVNMTVTQSFTASYDTATLLEAKRKQQKAGAIERPPQAAHTHKGPDGTPFNKRPHQMYLSEIANDEIMEDEEGGAEEHCMVPYSKEKCIDGNCEWMLDASKVFLSRRLAVGGFAEVFLGQYEGTRVAVKRLLSQANQEEFCKEVKLFAHLRHPNLLLFMGYTIQPTLSIVTEYMQRGSLFHIMGKRKEKAPLDQKLQKSVALSVARGMAYLHSRQPPILHLDLKSANILVDNSWKVKLGDFGLSQIRTNTFMSSAASAGGTPQWMAPEVLRSEKYGEAADVYSYGVVLWEVITGRAPWEDMHPMQVVGAVGFQGRMLPMPTHPDSDPVLAEMSMLCMSHDPARRPTFHDIVEILDAKFNQHAEVHGAESLMETYRKEHMEHDLSMESELDVSAFEHTVYGDRPTSSGSPRPAAKQDRASPFAGPPAPATSSAEQPKLYGLYRAPSAVTGSLAEGSAPSPPPTPSALERQAGAAAPMAQPPSVASPFADAAGGAPTAAPPAATPAGRAPSIISPFATFTAAAPAEQPDDDRPRRSAEHMNDDRPHKSTTSIQTIASSEDVPPSSAEHVGGDCPRSSAVSIQTIASSEAAPPSTSGRPSEQPAEAAATEGPPSTTSTNSSIRSATSTGSSCSSPSFSGNRLHMPSMVAFFAAERSRGGKNVRPGRCHVSGKDRPPPLGSVTVEDISLDMDNVALAGLPRPPCKIKQAIDALRSGWSCKANT